MSECAFDRREAVVIVNPAAHNRPKQKMLNEAGAWLGAQGWTVEWLETAGPGKATSMAGAAAARGTPLLFVCGGDGTLNEAVNGLAGSETAVSVIPAGTVNLWAREIGLLKKPIDAVRLTVEGVRRRADLGRAGSRYFLAVASYGIDAAVIHSVSHRLKGRLGAAAYVLSAVKQVMRYRGRPVTLSLDGDVRSANALALVAGNTRIYAGVTKVTPDALVDDGRLDVCVYEGRGRWDIVWLALLTLLKRHRRSKKVFERRVQSLTITTAASLPLQIDGDAIAESPAEVTVVPDALWVATPRHLRSPLFSRPP